MLANYLLSYRTLLSKDPIFFVVIVQHNNNIKYHMLHEIKL